MSEALNALLESGRENLQHLSESVDVGRQDMEALDSIVAQAHAGLSQRGSQSLDVLRSLLQSLQRTEHEFQEEHRRNISQLDASTGRVAQIERELAEGDDEANQFLDELRDRVDHAQHSADEMLPGVHSDLDELQSKVQHLRELAQQVQEQSGTHGTSVQQQVQTALDALSQNRDELVDKFQHVGETVTSKLDELSSALDAAYESIGQRLGDGLKALESQIEKVEETLKEQLEGETLRQIESALNELTSAIDGLHEVAEAGGGDFTDDLGGVLDNIQQVIDLIKSIEPVLELAHRLLD